MLHVTLCQVRVANAMHRTHLVAFIRASPRTGRRIEVGHFVWALLPQVSGFNSAARAEYVSIREIIDADDPCSVGAALSNHRLSLEQQCSTDQYSSCDRYDMT